MKIAYYTEVNLSDNDGPAVNELEFVKSLQTLNKEEYCIILSEENKDIPLLNNSNVYFLEKTPSVSALGTWIRRFLNIKRFLKQQKVSLIVSRVTDIPIPFLLVQLFVKDVKTAIKTAALWWEGRSVVKGVKNHLYVLLSDFLVRKVYKNADFIDVAMTETKDELIRRNLANINNIKLIDNAINTDMFTLGSPQKLKQQLGIPQGAQILGFAGSCPSDRGVVQMLKVAEAINAEINNLQR